MQPKCGHEGLRPTEAALEGDICREGINAEAWRLARTSSFKVGSFDLLIK